VSLLFDFGVGTAILTGWLSFCYPSNNFLVHPNDAKASLKPNQEYNQHQFNPNSNIRNTHPEISPPLYLDILLNNFKPGFFAFQPIWTN
jgi:hypothetical protein